MLAIGKLALAFVAAAMVATAVYATATDQILSRSNTSNEIPTADGGSLTVKHIYEFHWRIDSGEATLTAAQKRRLLNEVLEQIRSNIVHFEEH